MPRVVNTSKYVANALIPLCIWMMVSALLLYLIQVRLLFIEGGADRLRLGVLAFTLGVILLQRLTRQEGETSAAAYGTLLGLAITAFAAHQAYAYRIPIHPMLVFVANLVLFGLLWWVAHQITAACAADSAEKVAAAQESGALSSMRIGRDRFRRPAGRSVEAQLEEAAADPEREKVEEKWKQKLPARHPGRVILYFSLFAVPAFGLGVYLFGSRPDELFRIGIFLFVYLWSALSLLFLSSLSQLAAYFKERGMDLPDAIGAPWLGMGFAIVTVVMVVAFFLPQPPSASGAFVRERIMASYRGWEAEAGFREPLGEEAQPTGGGGPEEGSGSPDPGAEESAMAAGGASEGGGGRHGEETTGEDRPPGETNVRMRDSGEATEQMMQRPEAAPAAEEPPPPEPPRELPDAFGKAFDWIMRIVLIIAAIGAAVALLALLFGLWKGASGALGQQRWRRKQRKPKRAARKAPAGLNQFKRFVNPFNKSQFAGDGDALVRYLWQALLAYCEDVGSPVGPGQTPTEFVESRPPALEGFEEEARFLAEMVNLSEFSGGAVPEEKRPELQRFWQALERHAKAAA